MAIGSFTEPLGLGMDSWTYNPGVPLVPPFQIAVVPSWPTQVYVRPEEKLPTAITFRFSHVAPPGGGSDTVVAQIYVTISDGS